MRITLEEFTKGMRKHGTKLDYKELDTLHHYIINDRYAYAMFIEDLDLSYEFNVETWFSYDIDELENMLELDYNEIRCHHNTMRVNEKTALIQFC